MSWCRCQSVLKFPLQKGNHHYYTRDNEAFQTVYVQLFPKVYNEGMLPMMSITANKTIPAVTISLKSNPIFLFF